MFTQISLVDTFYTSPIILNSDLFELSFILVMPGSQIFPLLFGKCAGTCNIILTSIPHLNVFRDEISVSYFSISFNYHKIFLIFLVSDLWEVTTFDLTFVKTIEKGQWYVFIIFVFKVPWDPLLVFNFEILKNAKVHFHCWFILIELIIVII